MATKSSRRRFLKGVVAVSAAASGAGLQGQGANRVSGFDHVAVPMQNIDAMVAFYRRLGFQMTENENAGSVYIGTQMISFHRPTRWQDPSFTTRAPAAKPPCGDFCFVWDGTAAGLEARVQEARRAGG